MVLLPVQRMDDFVPGDFSFNTKDLIGKINSDAKFIVYTEGDTTIKDGGLERFYKEDEISTINQDDIISMQYNFIDKVIIINEKVTVDEPDRTRHSYANVDLLSKLMNGSFLLNAVDNNLIINNGAEEVSKLGHQVK
jgi:hypothetical protein